MLFVVGSGRCGTYSIAKAFKEMGYQSEHERWCTTTIQAGCWFATGRMSYTEARILLENIEWGQVEVDAKLSELVPVLADVFPDAKFLWVTRDPEQVEQSMITRGWYRESDDFAPSVYYAGWKKLGERMVLFLNLNHAGHRVNAWEVTDLPPEDWRSATQQIRCRWFIGWITARLEATLPPDRTRKIAIDTATVDELMGIAGWAFPDQPPLPLDAVPNVRLEEERFNEFTTRAAPRKDTVR